MAFYPDELSPIDRLRNAANPEFSDINLISKSRRQWKSLILGKKEVGMNSFATITEEKEEEISSDGSQPSNANHKSSVMPGVQNKRISFPKPRKYISGDRLDEEAIPTVKKLSSPIFEENMKANLTEVRQLIKGKKDSDYVFPKTEVTANYFSGDDSGKNWKEMATTSAPLLGWPKKEENKTVDSARGKIPEKKKSATAPLMNSIRSGDSKSQKKTQPKSSKPPEEVKKTPEKSAKSLNMRDVVNVYKNLTYGSKEEIKSFVEKLSFVKDDSTDKDKLSMMNLKALENKLKDFGKRPNKVEEKKPKEGKKKGKSEKRNNNHKAHLEQLARHKVIKVPATLNYTYSPESRSLSYGSSDREQVLARRSKQQSEHKTPWKYVGTQSILDRSYLVYPTIPSTPPKKTKKSSSVSSKNNYKKEERKTQPKPKPNSSTGAKTSNEFSWKRPSSIMRFSGSNKSMNPRPSATTVCKIEFRPTGKIGDLDPDDPSLLVYLHGTKAINVKLPYADKQFSRVKFFRKYGSRVPLIKGIDRDALSNDYQNVSVKNIRLPSELSRYKFESLLDFDEDIQNLNDFLNSQSDLGKNQGSKRKMKNSSPREESLSPKSSPKLSPDLIIQEISQDIESLQYLPDTEENRKIIANFFDELDQKIESTKAQKFIENAADHYGQMIPIVGY